MRLHQATRPHHDSDTAQALDEAEASHILIHFKDGAGSRKFKGLYAFVPDHNEVRVWGGGRGTREEEDGGCTFITLTRIAAQARKVHGAGPRVVTAEKVAAFFK